jgi:hypothetical protein
MVIEPVTDGKAFGVQACLRERERRTAESQRTPRVIAREERRFDVQNIRDES